MGLKKTGLYTKEGKYFIEYHTDGFCYMNKEGVPVPTESLKNKEGTVTGKWTCTNNKVKCTPI